MGTGMRFAIIGAGFWARYQLAGWYAIEGLECAAICDRVASKARSLAHEFTIAKVYGDALEMLRREKLDFVDVVTSVDSHPTLVRMAAQLKIPVVCQKPMASDYQSAAEMVHTCQNASIPFFVNENWRWQAPLRELKKVLESGVIGDPFRARLDMISGFPVFDNQPSLKLMEQFILTDLGSHLFDVARFLFGEAQSVYCRVRRVHKDIRGEDVATTVLQMQSGVTVLVQLAYAGNHLERECFPQTLVFLEGSKGSAEIGPDYVLKVTTSGGTQTTRHVPPHYAWADARYEVVHSSIVPCQQDILKGLRGGDAETTGADNLKTLRLVFASYESAAKNEVVVLES